MIRQLCTSVCLALVSAAIPLRAANRPHAGTDSQKSRVWTNEDLEKLHALGLVSIVGKVDQEASVPQYAPGDYETTEIDGGMRRGRRNCAVNLNAGRLGSMNTVKRSKIQGA